MLTAEGQVRPGAARDEEWVDNNRLEQLIGTSLKTAARGFPSTVGETPLRRLDETPGQVKNLQPPSFKPVGAVEALRSGLPCKDISRAKLKFAFDIGFPFYYSLLFDNEVISMLDEKSRDELFVLALQCALEPRMMSNVQLRVGLGIHDGEDHSIRLPAYLYPVTRIISRLCAFYKEQNISITPDILPQVLVYSAANSVIRTNGLVPDQARRNRETHFEALRRFVKTQIPSEAQKAVSFREDLETVNKEVEEAIATFAVQLQGFSAHLPPVQKIMSTARRHGTDPTVGLRYGVSHAIYSRDAGPLQGFTYVQHDEVKPVIIMMGGAAEVDFWRLRKTVSRLGTGGEESRRQIQIIQTTGIEPPYQRPAENDISVSQACSMGLDNLHAKMRNAAMRAFEPDYAALQKAGVANPERLRELFY